MAIRFSVSVAIAAAASFALFACAQGHSPIAPPLELVDDGSSQVSHGLPVGSDGAELIAAGSPEPPPPLPDAGRAEGHASASTCASCLREECPVILRACILSGECAALVACYGACNGDSDCRDACDASGTLDAGASTLVPVRLCMRSSCADACAK
jgi:hypothetical protein